MANTNPARGTRDFLPSDVRKREYVIGIIKEVYESYGFEPLETPSFENLETLTGKYGEEGNQLIFKILKRGEALKEGAAVKDLSDLALRYDLTVPLARVVAHHKNDLPKFFKRYQIQPVWRADRPAKGRYREFYQCDVDAIGSDSMVVEAEQISAVSEILERLGFDNFVIRINHRLLLTALLEIVGIPAEKHSDALVSLDKLDKIQTDGVYSELKAKGIDEESADQLTDLFVQMGELVASATDNFEANAKFLGEIQSYFREDDPQGLGRLALADIRNLITISANKHVLLDPSLARGLSYYTGAIMEINVPDLAGSLGGGGRYDGLIGMFGKEQIPACGVSLGLERILVVMEERGMFPPEIAASASADVMVTIWNEDYVSESLELAATLRKQKLRVLVYPQADKHNKQLKYASQINVPFVCDFGEDEKLAGTVSLKNMKTGTRESVAAGDVGKIILDSLKSA